MENKENLNLLIRVGQHMTFTLNDLLDASRLEDKQIQLKKTDVNLHTITSVVLDIINFMTDEKKLKIEQQIPTTFPQVSADENRLMQILFNLVHNAVKFTNEGSVTIAATHKNGMAAITISDTGIGMSEQIKRRAFLPYTQDNSHKKSIEGGLGLGLNI